MSNQIVYEVTSRTVRRTYIGGTTIEQHRELKRIGRRPCT